MSRPTGPSPSIPGRSWPRSRQLTRELLTIEGQGDYARARALLEAMAVVRPETQRVLDRLQDVPVDIEPRFTTAERLTR